MLAEFIFKILIDRLQIWENGLRKAQQAQVANSGTAI